jgi:hypothetical protein
MYFSCYLQATARMRVQLEHDTPPTHMSLILQGRTVRLEPIKSWNNHGDTANLGWSAYAGHSPGFEIHRVVGHIHILPSGSSVFAIPRMRRYGNTLTGQSEAFGSGVLYCFTLLMLPLYNLHKDYTSTIFAPNTLSLARRSLEIQCSSM